jgi:hypothetical protein
MRTFILCVALALGGCASASTVPLSQDTFKITGRAAPVCGAAGAERMAVRQAAVEVIKRGYDRYMILGEQQQSNVVGVTPITVQRTGYGSGFVSGGDPIVAHSEGMVVKMFRDNDPAAANALSARAMLGAKLAGDCGKACADLPGLIASTPIASNAELASPARTT